jgi:hypothetical protein
VLINVLEWLLFNVPDYTGSPIAELLRGNAIGATPWLATAVLVYVLVLAIIRRTRSVNIFAAVVIFFVVGAITALWFQVMDVLRGMGTDLAHAAIDLFKNGQTDAQQQAIFPDISIGDAILAICGFFIAIVLAAILILIIALYQMAYVLLSFFGALVLSVIALGRRTRQLMNALVALILVAVVIGLPVAIVILEASMAYSGLFVNTPFATYMTVTSVIVGLFGAIAAQPLLFILVLVLTTWVEGKVSAVVTGGRLFASNSDTSPEGMQRYADRANRASISGRESSLIGAAVAAGAGLLASKGGAMLAAKAVASTTPAGAAVAVGSSILVSRVIPQLVAQKRAGATAKSLILSGASSARNDIYPAARQAVGDHRQRMLTQGGEPSDVERNSS